MAIPDDMEQVNFIIERDYARSINAYRRSDGRRLSKSAAVRDLVIFALRAHSFLPTRSVERTEASSIEQAAA